MRNKNYKILFSALVILMLAFCKAGLAQTTPTIFLNGTEVSAANLSSGSPVWISAGQTLQTGNLVKYISVMQFNIASDPGGGKALQFDSIISVTTLKTVPANKGWKVESVSLDPTAAIFGGDNLGNHVATTNLNMSSKKINNLSDPVSLSDAVNSQTLQNGNLIYAVDAGAANAYIVTLSPAPSAYTAGMILSFKAVNANTGASTINVNSLGAKTIKKQVTTDLSANDILSGQLVTIIYDGTNFQMIGQTGQASGVGATGKFGGSGSDGALNISSGTTTLDLGGAAYFTKNYTSISITGTGQLAFSNPHANGTIIIMKSKGDLTITSSTNPAIDLRNMGSQAGTGSGPGTSGGGGLAGTGFLTNSGSGGGGSCGGGGNGAYASNFNYFNVPIYATKSIRIACGSGGGGGTSGYSGGSATVGGNGGKGAGAIYLECGGSFNFSGSINADGSNGSNGGSGNPSAGGGGGGGGGSVIILYNTLVANTGTVSNKGGTGGNAGAGSSSTYCSGGGGGGGGSVGGTGGQGGGVSCSPCTPGSGGGGAGGGGNGTAGTTGSSAAGGAGGAAGGYIIMQNTEFY